MRYYPIDVDTFEDQTMNSGANPLDEIRDLPGTLNLPQGLYITEDAVEERPEIIRWLEERCAIGPNPMSEKDVLDPEEDLDNCMEELSEEELAENEDQEPIR